MYLKFINHSTFLFFVLLINFVFYKQSLVIGNMCNGNVLGTVPGIVPSQEGTMWPCPFTAWCGPPCYSILGMAFIIIISPIIISIQILMLLYSNATTSTHRQTVSVAEKKLAEK